MKIERIKAVRELAELEFQMNQLKLVRNEAENKCRDLGFKDMYDIYDFIRENMNGFGTVGLKECKAFVEQQFPVVHVEDMYGVACGDYDNLHEALQKTIENQSFEEFFFFQNGIQIAKVVLTRV